MRRDISSHSRMWYTLHNITKIEKNRGWIIFCNRNQNIGYLSKDLDFYRTVSFLSDNTDFNELKLLRLSGEYVFKIRILRREGDNHLVPLMSIDVERQIH